MILPEVLFSSAIWRPVVVGQVEMCDALVEGVAQHFTLNIERAVVAEVVTTGQARSLAGLSPNARRGDRPCIRSDSATPW